MAKKKIASFLVVGLSVILLTGCFSGGETLRCTYDVDGAIIEQNMNFRNNQISRTELTVTMDLDDDILDDMGMDLDDFMDMLRDEVNRQGDFRGVTATVDLRGNQIINRTIVEYNELDEDDISLLIMMGLVSQNWDERIDISETRSELEREGFTCR